VHQLFVSAGVRDVRTAHGTVLARFRDAAHLIQFSWSHGQRAMWEAVPPQEHDRVAAHVTEAFEAIAEPDGSAAFAQEVRYTLGTRG